LALAAGADAGLALGLLLGSAAGRFLGLAAREVAAVLCLAFVLGRTGLLERDGDRLAPALHLAALAARPALQLAVRVFVHDAAHGLALGHRCLGHDDPPEFLACERRAMV